MKTLGFDEQLVPALLSGEKTTTWRLYDDKFLRPGEHVTFVEWKTRRPFATAQVRSVRRKTLRSLAPHDYLGHEHYPDREAMLATQRRYYGDKVSDYAPLAVISFALLSASESGRE